MPPLTGVIETALYVDDLDRASRFYEDVFSLQRMRTVSHNCPSESLDRTTAAARCTLRSRSWRKTLAPGKKLSTPRGSRSRAVSAGRAAAPAFISAILTTISSSSQLPACGLSTESRRSFAGKSRSYLFRLRACAAKIQNQAKRKRACHPAHHFDEKSGAIR